MTKLTINIYFLMKTVAKEANKQKRVKNTQDLTRFTINLIASYVLRAGINSFTMIKRNNEYNRQGTH